MKKNKGFSIVELLGAIAVMGILMIVTVPSVISIIDNSKKTTYIDDAKKLVALAKNKIKTDTNIKRPTYNKNNGTYRCVGFYYNTLVKEGEIEKGPEGGSYNLSDDTSYSSASFVIVKYDSTRDNDKYIYSVQLIEKYTQSGVVSYKGVGFVSDARNLNNQDATKRYIINNKNEIKNPSEVGCFEIKWY